MGPEKTRIIAIVDDDPAICDSLRVVLEIYGFQVRTYVAPAELLQDGHDVACLIVDYQMPDLNGFELVSELQRQGKSVPTIMITSHSDCMIEERAARLSIRHVLKKPLINELLLNAIRDEMSKGDVPGTLHLSPDS